jgi:heat shock protein HslJ
MKLRTAAVVLLLFLAACATAKKEPPPKPFAGTRWEVVVEREPTPQRVRPWFVFGDGLLEGFAGCNQVTAHYVQDTVGAGAIAVGRLNVGHGGCDARVQIIQTHILEVLQAASSYSITGDVLTMSGSGGTLVLRAAPGATP